MAYFDYVISSHLLRPSTVLVGDNTTYKGITSVVPSGLFDKSQVNANFFNLAKSAVDNTERITILEGKPVISESSNSGYVIYYGRKEAQGMFYGGPKLVLPQSSSIIPVFPYSFDTSTHKYGFKIAVGGAISYSGSGIANVDNTIWTNIKLDGSTPFLGDTSSGAGLADQTAMLSYLHKTLNKSVGTSNVLERGTLAGSPGININTNWSTTWGNLNVTTQSFVIYWNDGYLEETKSGSTGTLKKATITLNSIPVQDAGYIAGVINSAILSAITLADSSLSNTAVNTYYDTVTNSFKFTINAFPQTSTTRASGSVYECTLKQFGSDPILNWLGWLPQATPDSSTTVRVHDYAKVLQFSFNNTGNLVASGTDSYADIALIDGISDLSFGTFFNSFGISIGSPGVVYYHTLAPSSTWTKTLNYGGQLSVTGVNTTGASSFGGNTSFSGNVTFGSNEVSVPGGFTITPTFTSGEAFPAMTAVSLSSSGKLFRSDKSAGGSYYRTMGIALDASSGADQSVRVVCSGLVKNYTTGLSTAEPMFTGSLGVLTQDFNSINNGQYRQVVGYAVNSTDVMISIEEPSEVVDPGVPASVRISYIGSPGITFNTSEFVAIPYNNPAIIDTNNAFNAGFGAFTVPLGGTYLVTCSVAITSTVTAGVNSYLLEVAGGSESYHTLNYDTTNNGGVGRASITAIVTANIGSIIYTKIKLVDAGGGATAVVKATPTQETFIQIVRLGV